MAVNCGLSNSGGRKEVPCPKVGKNSGGWKNDKEMKGCSLKDIDFTKQGWVGEEPAEAKR